ncbi:hypothetical protein YC2023_083584 [Brassica napus]
MYISRWTLPDVHFRCTLHGYISRCTLLGIFILDECHKLLESLGMLISNILVCKNISLACFNISNTSLSDMRRDVQEIFKMTPHDKQVRMFP